MTSYSARYPKQAVERERGSGVLAKVVALFLGIAVAVLAIVAVTLVKTADDARDEAQAAAATTDQSAHSTASSGAVSLPLQSFAGKTGENAEALAQAHVAYDATLPAVPAGDLVKVQMTLKDMVIEVAPGVKYNTWAFDGHGAPGPIVHVREGQTVEMTLTNGGAIPHSIDFHAARIAPNVAFRDIAPGDSFTFASRPVTLASTCTTAAPSRCSRISQTACTARSSSTLPRRFRKPTRSTSSSPASGT